MHIPTTFQPLAASDTERDSMLVERADSLIGLLNEHGSLLYINPASQRVLGNLAADAPTTVVRALLHPDDLLAMRNQWQDVLASGSGLLTYRIRAADGTWRWLETHATCTEHEDQRYVIVVSHDISNHKRAENKWQHSGELFRVMVRKRQGLRDFCARPRRTDRNLEHRSGTLVWVP